MKEPRLVVIAAALFVSLTASNALAHCQIPCGIYDDAARFALLEEHVTTIEKAMKTLEELSAAQSPNYNQIVRWVRNKEHHADEISEIVTRYFMAQRVKPAEKKSEEAWLRALIKQFKASYLGA
jgi:nickel superoxide dismutase